MKRSEIFFSTLLIPIDAIALVAAFITAYYLRDNYTPQAPGGITLLTDRFQLNSSQLIALEFDKYFHYVSLLVPVMIIIFALVGLYAIRSTDSWLKRIANIMIGVSVGECFILLLFLLRKDFFIPRSTVLYSWVLGIVFVLVGRLIINFIQRWLHRFNIGVVQIAVIGHNATARRVVKLLGRQSGQAYKVVKQLESLPVKEVIKHLGEQHIDELIVVNEHYNNEDLIVLRNYCLEEHITFSFVPSLLTELQSNYDIRTLKGLPTIEVRPTPLEGWGRVVKRLFDIIMATFFIVLFSPLFVIITLSLKIASPGPLIYKHKRIGRNGRPIYIWKFRSMKWEYCTGVGHNGDAAFEKLLADNPKLAKEWEETQKLKDDPRVSLPGTIIRKTSLDELPQFFNVLLGTLSLVGPRPIVQEEIRKYGERARILFTVRPGVTGLWQISGRNDTSYSERIALDAQYIEHWSLWSDIIIMIKTAGVILGKARKGAY